MVSDRRGHVYAYNKGSACVRFVRMCCAWMTHVMFGVDQDHVYALEQGIVTCAFCPYVLRVDDTYVACGLGQGHDTHISNSMEHALCIFYLSLHVYIYIYISHLYT